jgi:adenine-specific DNA-methyltransferase
MVAHVETRSRMRAAAQEIVSEVMDWLQLQPARPMPSWAVPGTSRAERTLLAALGGLAGALAPSKQRTPLPPSVRDWFASGPKPPRSLVKGLAAVISADEDPLGVIYELAVGKSSRRRLGTVFTPPAVVQYMLGAGRAAVASPGLIADPGAGIGAFSLESLRQWSHSRVVAVDLNVVTLGLLAAQREVQPSNRLELVYDDYLKWIRKLSADGAPRLYLGNPPYTRRHEMSENQFQSCRRGAGGLIKSAHAGLSTYFLAATLNALRPTDGLCFLLPASWTRAAYAQLLRSELWGLTTRAVTIASFPRTLELFPGISVQATVLVVGEQKPAPQPLTLRHLVLERDEVQVVHERRQSRRAGVSTTLDPDGRRHSGRRSESSVLLGDVVRVRRGVATGANTFFFIRDEDIDGIPRAAILPALYRMRYATADVLDAAAFKRIGVHGYRRWLLDVTKDLVDESPSLRAWVRRGRSDSIHLRTLTSRRRPWYSMEQVAPPDVIIGSMGKSVLRVVENLARCVPANSMYGLYFLEESIRSPVTEWLRSREGQRAIQSAGRNYGRGLIKVEPRELHSVQLPSRVVS